MAGRIRWRNLVDSPSPTALERLQLGALSGASCLYRAGLALDRCLHRLRGPWRPPVPSVCVGNITVGGTGKTTLVRHLARRLEDRGIRAAVILRGYGRLDPRSTRVVHDGRSLLEGPDTAGDEAVMLAQGLSRTVVVVGPSRRASSELALTRLGVQALLFDDGLQHWGLSTHRTVALWDATVDPSRARLLPRGCLREPLGGLRRFDVLIITRCDAAPDCARVAEALGRIRGGAAAPSSGRASASIFSSSAAKLRFTPPSATRSCGRRGPAREGSTLPRSSVRRSVYSASGVPGPWKSPCALLYASTSAICSAGRPVKAR